jgi:hypothetical protein
MWPWLLQNKQWVFSGIGVTALGALWWAITRLWPNRKAAVTTFQASNANISPNIAPVITNTINFPELRAPEPDKHIASIAPIPSKPEPRPNLCVEGIKMGKISLEDDVWTLRQTFGRNFRPKRALLADISNVPTEDMPAAKAAVRAAIRMDYGIRQLTYSPLPWLEEFNNTVYLETGARKTVVVAVGEDSQTGGWSFVLNHRSDYVTKGSGSAMDWSNACPLPSDTPFEMLMIDMNSGAVLAKFVFVWTFDTANNWPCLKNID